MRYLYLLLNLGSILIPFSFSFYSKAPFFKKWGIVGLSIFISGVLFVAWDEWFTRIGIWGFNPKYLSGIYVGSLPIEEVLFFICIPYSCVFTYEALKYLIKDDWLQPFHRRISTGVIIIMLSIGLLNIDRYYTAFTFISLSILLCIIEFAWRPKFMGRFYTAYIAILIPYFLVNGILTGALIEDEVVWYNDHENLGIRIGTIPIEDSFYGMLLILANVSLVELFSKGRSNRQDNLEKQR